MSALKLHELPIDILIIIIQKLTLNDVPNLLLTCKALKNIIVTNNAIWRHFGHRKFIIHDQGKSIKSNSYWYDCSRLSINWCKGIFVNKTIINHKTCYMPWIKYHNSEALLLTVGANLHCYSTDKTGIPNGRHLCWKVAMPKIPRYDKRTDDISRFVLKDNLIACGNRNGSTAVYKVDNINSQPQLIQYIADTHASGMAEVSDVDIINNSHGNFLVTSSLNCPFINLWSWGASHGTDLSTGGCDIKKLEAPITRSDPHAIALWHGVKCIKLNSTGDKLLVGPDCLRHPTLVDVSRLQVVIDPADNADVDDVVQDVQWHDDNTACYVTYKGSLRMMDIRTAQVVYEMSDPFQSSFYCVKTDGHRAVITGTNQYSRCVLFDVRKKCTDDKLNSSGHVQLYFTQKRHSPVYSLDFDSSKLIAAVDFGVSVLNFNVPSSNAAIDYSHPFSGTIK